MKNQEIYRRGVCGIFLSKDGLVLLGERAEQPGQWQFPQGGMEDGETIVEALHREMDEEVGIRKLAIIRQTEEFIAYNFPDGLFKNTHFIGQQHIYFVLDGSTIKAESIKARDEFARFAWFTPQEAYNCIVHWKKGAYLEALGLLGFLIKP